jgi:hypothetical protein
MEAAMATKIAVVLEDDLDGGPADETVRLAIDGTDYQIDLSTYDAAAFRRQFAPTSNTPAGKAQDSGSVQGRTVVGRARRANIRAWAKVQAIALGGSGRIPADVVEQYQAAKEGW